ncbi:MAG: S8 family peptidase [Actinomycetota bacterium]|nr:S8 family peptidase [Actinomycetota bacterium]
MSFWGMQPAVLRQMRTTWIVAALAIIAAVALLLTGGSAGSRTWPPAASASTRPATADQRLAQLAAERPAQRVEVIVQLRHGADLETGRAAVRRAGGRVTRELHIINALGARLPAAAAERLASNPHIAVVSLNAHVKPTGTTIDSSALATAYGPSVGTEKVWNGNGLTGKGVGVAVIDTGVAGDQPDFRTSPTDASSRVIAAAVTNPQATTATDAYGHGTHVAGIIAGNGLKRSADDPLRGKYIGVAPDAQLISVKASDDAGAVTVLDVIYGLQFVVDHQADYNIRVVNLSLESSDAQSYLTDPLDAAVESAWFHGIVVVAAAGNRGAAPGAVNYAPANDPYVISVGGVDDQGTKSQVDDTVASWTSYGTTQDGFAKPDVLAPGAHIVAPLAPDSAFAALCPACIVDGQYIRAGGTSMAAPVVSGAVADLLQAHPGWTPDDVKGALRSTARPLPGPSFKMGEIVANKAVGASGKALASNDGLAPNSLVDATTGDIDFTRATWSRATWSGAGDLLRATWSRATWSCDCSLTSNGKVDPARATWSRATWSTSFSK